MKHAEEEKFQHAAQQGHEDIEEHAAADVAADAHEVIDSKDDGGDRGAERIHAQILHRQVRKSTFRTHQANEGRRRSVERTAHRHAGRHNHQAGAGEQVVGLFPLSLAQADGDWNGGADADEIRKRKIDDHKRHGKVERGKCGGAQILADKNAVQRLIQGGGQHADGAGQRSQKEEFHRRCFGKQCGGIHKSCLHPFLKNSGGQTFSENSSPLEIHRKDLGKASREGQGRGGRENCFAFMVCGC